VVQRTDPSAPSQLKGCLHIACANGDVMTQTGQSTREGAARDPLPSTAIFMVLLVPVDVIDI
jgi:hypothetical protein